MTEIIPGRVTVKIDDGEKKPVVVKGGDVRVPTTKGEIPPVAQRPPRPRRMPGVRI